MEEENKHFHLNNLVSKLRQSPLFVTVFQIASIWIVSDLSYEFIKEIIDGGISYNGNPFLITFYYIFWIFVATSSFWDIYIKWELIKNEIFTYSIVLLIIGFIATYFIYILPLVPSIAWSLEWKPPSELAFANGWYFLPKSAEIILQQLLVSALALSFYNAKFSIKTASAWCAGLFGSAHLLLIFGGPSLSYVALFTTSATIAGFIFPYLILNVKNGFMYSYILHWSFYALLVLLAHTVYKI